MLTIQSDFKTIQIIVWLIEWWMIIEKYHKYEVFIDNDEKKIFDDHVEWMLPWRCVDCMIVAVSPSGLWANNPILTSPNNPLS